MRFHKHNVGVMLAIVAGLLGFGYALWPITPQTRTASSEVWLLVVTLSTTAFLAAAFVVDRLPAVSRLLLVGGAVALVASGSLFGMLFGGGEARLAALIDLVPAVLALIAAAIIGPVVASRDTI